MKVFVNQEGELAIGELAFVFTDSSYLWIVFNGHERFYFTRHPHECGYKYLSEL